MVWTLIRKTAWPMTPPAPWSAFHVAFLLAGLAAAVCLTRFFCLPLTESGTYAPAIVSPDTKHPRFERTDLVLFVCGIILTTGEIYKQLFLYEVVNQGSFDWWYFPFQLCSTPMYLCLVFPFLPHGRCRQTAAVYLESFGFLGGIMALLEPSGLMHPYWTLTIHGLVWHILLIFIACYCAASGLTDRDDRHFLSALMLFFLFCVPATVVNLITVGQADMFYISPYYPITQVVFHEISLALGIGPGIGIYLASIGVGAYLSHRLLGFIFGN